MGWLPTALQGLFPFIAPLRRFEGRESSPARMLLATSTAALAASGLDATRLVACVSLRHSYAVGCGLHGRGEWGADGTPGLTGDTAGNAARVNARWPLACGLTVAYHGIIGFVTTSATPPTAHAVCLPPVSFRSHGGIFCASTCV